MIATLLKNRWVRLAVTGTVLFQFVWTGCAAIDIFKAPLFLADVADDLLNAWESALNAAGAIL